MGAICAMAVVGATTSAQALPTPAMGGLVNIPMGSDLADMGNAMGLAVNPLTNQVYVGVDGPREGVAVVNDRDEVVDFIAVPDGALSLSFDPNSGLLYAVGKSRPLISEIDPQTKSVSTYSLGARGTLPVRVSVDAVHQKVYVENRNPDDDTVVVFDEITKKSEPEIVLDRIGTGGGLLRPQSVAVDPYRQKAYALVAHSSLHYGVVTVIDGPSNKVDGAPITVSPTTSDIAFDPLTHMLYVASSDGVTIIDTTTRAAVGPILSTGPSGALSVSVDPASHRVFAGTPDGRIAVIQDRSPAAVTGSVAIGGPSLAQPQQMVVNPRTGRAYSANGNSFWISALTLGAPAISSGTPPHARAGTNYSFTISAVGLPRAQFSAATPLPGWLSLNPDTGELTGTPTGAGVFSLNVSASNGVGADASASYTLIVEPQVRPCLPWICGGS